MQTSELTGVALDWAVAKAAGRMLIPSQIAWARETLNKAGWEQERIERYVSRLKDATMMLNDAGNPVPLAAFSTDWSLAWPIIEREGISIIRCDDDCEFSKDEHPTVTRTPVWAAEIGIKHSLEANYDARGSYFGDCLKIDPKTYGPTPLVAAMRCYVKSRLGDEIEILDELLFWRKRMKNYEVNYEEE